MFVFQHPRHWGERSDSTPAWSDRTGVNCEPPETRARAWSGRPGTVAAGTAREGCERKALGGVS